YLTRRRLAIAGGGGLAAAATAGGHQRRRDEAGSRDQYWNPQTHRALLSTARVAIAAIVVASPSNGHRETPPFLGFAAPIAVRRWGGRPIAVGRAIRHGQGASLERKERFHAERGPGGGVPHRGRRLRRIAGGPARTPASGRSRRTGRRGRGRYRGATAESA